MTIGEHITLLRKKKGISQGTLGKLIGTSGDIIGRYERSEVKPSIDVVINLAKALEVSLDFLVGNTSLELDQTMLSRLEQLSSLPSEQKEHILSVVDALIRDFKNKQAYA